MFGAYIICLYLIILCFVSCRYAIDRKTDVNRQFSIDGHGLVTTAKKLDREKVPVHRVHVHAIDKGKRGAITLLLITCITLFLILFKLCTIVAHLVH